MKKHPFLMALVILGAIFLFFVVLISGVAFFRGKSPAFPIGDKVGVIEVTGPIVSSKKIIENILDFKGDKSIKAIVLRVESPGGGVGPSQEIYQEVKKAADSKPVVVSMGAVAASGGYYIAVPAQRILANPGTITGSIGVIMEFTNFQELLDKIGLSNQVVKSGKHKDIGSPLRPMSDDDRKILQSVIDDVHSQFVAAISEGRKMDTEKVRSLADGRIFTGRQALDAGLVDELGNLQDAVAVAGRLGGISGEPRVVYPAEDKPGLLEYLIQETASQIRHGLSQRSADGLQFLWSGVD